MMKLNFEPSNYQKDILDFIKTKSDNLLIDAKAGSGKTSTLELIAQNFKEQNKDFFFMSFNKSIVQELQDRIGDKDRIKTVHSLGQKFLASYLFKKYKTNYKLNLDGNKLKTLCKAYYDKYFKNRIEEYLKGSTSKEEIASTHRTLIDDFVNVCNFIRLYGLDYKNIENIDTMASKFTRQLSLYINKFVLIDYSDLVIAVLDKSIDLFLNPVKTNNYGQIIIDIDFVDMIYFPVYFNMSVPQSILPYTKTVLVDECQDLSMLQQLLIKQLVTNDNRFIFVGDKNQSIYGFNGADVYAMDRISQNFKPETLPLSICYRCPKNIVKLAQTIVPDISWNEKREDEGTIYFVEHKDLYDALKPNDVLIGRTNTDLLDIFMAFTIEHNKQIKFKNDEIINKILSELKFCINNYLLLYSKCQNIDKYVYEHMKEFTNKTGLKRKTKEYKVEQDKFIKEFIDAHLDEFSKKLIMKSNQTIDYLGICMDEYKELGAYNYSKSQLETQYFKMIDILINKYRTEYPSKVLLSDFIEYLDNYLRCAQNDKDVPILCSIHSMKGSEADNVFIYDYPMFPYDFASSEDEKQQELNLQYVAITRAKKQLYLVMLDCSDPILADNNIKKNFACKNKVIECLTKGEENRDGKKPLPYAYFKK